MSLGSGLAAQLTTSCELALPFCFWHQPHVTDTRQIP